MQNSQLSLLYKWQKLFILSDNTVQSWFVTGRNKEWKSDLDLSQYLTLKPDQGHQALLWSRGQGQVRMNFHQKQDQVLVHTGLETLYFEWFEITYWAHEKCEKPKPKHLLPHRFFPFICRYFCDRGHDPSSTSCRGSLAANLSRHCMENSTTRR